MWLNEMDVEDAVMHVTVGAHRDEHQENPNVLECVDVLDRYVQVINENSDGWPYWKRAHKPSEKLQKIVYDHVLAPYGKRFVTDVGPDAMKRAFTPIKSFMTKRGLDKSLVFERK